MIEQPSQPNFDRIARLYRLLEYLTLGPALQHCRTHFLPHLRDCRRALVLGDGDGRFLERLLAANPHLRADAVDTSAGMLRLLRDRCGETKRLQSHQMSALSYVPARDCDLVVAHFFLDCLTQAEVNRLVATVCQEVQPDALWLISDFRIPSGLLRLPARLLVRTLYLAFRVLTGLRTNHLPDHATPLSAEGLVCIAQHHSLFGVLSTEIWSRQGRSEFYNHPMKNSNPEPDETGDPIPPTEPAVPSLDEPDPGVFHHEPATTPEKPSQTRSSR